MGITDRKFNFESDLYLYIYSLSLPEEMKQDDSIEIGVTLR